MSTTMIYAIPGYPAMYLTEDRTQLTIRPMVPEDQNGLLDFFRRIPQADRFGLKEDVTDPKTIERWALTLDYSRVLPLLAILDGNIVGDGTLHYRRAGARRHVGEVRVVVAPTYSNRGIGKGLLHKLIEIAGERGLEKLMFEVIDGMEAVAQHTAQTLGFVPVAVLPDHVCDADGKLYHLMIMERRLLGFELSAEGKGEPYLPFF